MSRAVVACLLVACGRVDFDALSDAAPAPLSVTKLEVYDWKTDTLIADVTNGAAANVTGHPDGVTLVATVAGMPGSVDLVRGSRSDIENGVPYASGGDTGGDLNQDLHLAIGKTQVMITAYELADAMGVAGPSRMFDVELALPLDGPPAIARIGITDDANNNFIEIKEGAVVSIANANLAMESDLRIEPVSPMVGSVEIGGVGPWTIRSANSEDWAPYTAMGSGRAFTPTPGTYTITARAFPLGRSKGVPGPTFSVTFQLVP